jgi:antirestriction protein ArdC
MSKNAEVYAKVAATIIDAMESGTVPWEKNWVGGKSPRNAITGHRYAGMNVWALAFTALAKGYATNGWLTFNQARKRGMMVQKGQKAVPVYFMATLHKKPKRAGDEPEKFFVARLFFVFNLDQVADLPGHEGTRAKLIRKMVAPVAAFEPIDAAEELVARSGAKIIRAEDAWYQPERDVIGMPRPTSFKKGAEGYYPVLFHELSHWTGHASRLDRKLVGNHARTEYAMEELVAELSAAFLSHQIGLDHTSRAASYLASWLRALKENPDALARAASLAQKAADFLLPPEEVEEGDDEAEELEAAVA